MDGDTLTQYSLEIPNKLQQPDREEDSLTAECRNLIEVLSRKIEALCHECDDSDRVIHIRSLTASMTTLNNLLRTMESEQTFSRQRGLLKDTRGFTYVSVRNCDLERFSAK